MNLQETLQLLDKLNSVGAKHFKSQDLEVSLVANLQPNTTNVVPQKIDTTNVVQPEPPINQENTAKAKNLIDMLKMTPEELANQIFPEGA